MDHSGRDRIVQNASLKILSCVFQHSIMETTAMFNLENLQTISYKSHLIGCIFTNKQV